MTTIEVLVLRGAMASSVAITFDVLATANRLRRIAGSPPAFGVDVTGSGARSAKRLAAQLGDAPSSAASLIVVPGLGLTSETAIVEGLGRRDVALARKRLMEAESGGTRLAASCSSVFLLAAAGVLEGRRATTTWWLAPVFRRLFPRVHLDTDALVIVDGSSTTAGAAMAHMDLMLAVVARYAGAPLASECARYLLLDERRSQAPYVSHAVLAGTDETVARARRWACDRLEEGVTVDGLAAAVGLAPRTFARRVEQAIGLSPVRFLQRLRVERAVELVQTTRLSFEEIARRVGYAEPSTLRRLMQKEGCAGPRDLRARSAPQQFVQA
jgi:transcriptional regulator GlxA family with amidase domain